MNNSFQDMQVTMQSSVHQRIASSLRQVQGSNLIDPLGQSIAVMQVVPQLDLGITARSAVDLGTILSKSGGRSIIVSAGGRMVAEARRGGSAHVVAKTDSDSIWHLGRLSFNLKAQARRQRVSLLHARSPGTAWATGLAARALSLPYVVSLTEQVSTSQRRHRWFQEAMRDANHVIALSATLADHAVSDLKIAPEKLSVIAPGVNIARFNPGGVVVDRIIRLAQRWLLPDGVPVILMPCQLVEGAGHEVLIEALAKLGDRNFVCFILGDDTASERYRSALEDLAIERGLESRLRFAGFCEDMPAAYMLADVVVRPSLKPAAFDLVAAEAQAMGRPVIATTDRTTPLLENAAHSASQVFLPNQTGWFVPVGDAAALAASIDAALSLAAPARENIAIIARERMERHFSIDQMAAKTLALYRTVLGQHAAASS